jgi:flagellar protein FlbD
VIRLTRLNSQPITVNSDLIKCVESNPDTVITLVSGDKILVHETTDEVIARVIEFRRAVIAGLPIGAGAGAAMGVTSRTSLEHMINPPAEGRSRG